MTSSPDTAAVVKDAAPNTSAGSGVLVVGAGLTGVDVTGVDVAGGFVVVVGSSIDVAPFFGGGMTIVSLPLETAVS
ncbi:MAG: hypothetical protein N0E58_03885 [Candidatus Thiodiazotropha endolucinida]|nr:hypothetical protein [Candidatus Thiodiazotropha endolucinida]